MELPDFVNQVVGFDKLQPREKIKLFAWFLHTHRNLEHFDYDALRACYKEIHLTPPDIGTYVTRMVGYKELTRERNGFKLMRPIRIALDAKYGVHQSVIVVDKILTDLPEKVPSVEERTFLQEALTCYRSKAFRSCIVMTWNLAYAHLLDWILNEPARLSAFNAAIPGKFPKAPKKAAVVITRYDDFADEFKELEVIDICAAAQLTSKNTIRILKEKLGKRNIAAHPSSIVVVQSQADDVVTDLVNNVVLALN